MSAFSNTSEARAAFAAQLREFADLVESTPAIPIPNDVDVWAHIQEYGSGLPQAQRFSLVHDFAEAFDVPVKMDTDGCRGAEKHFGMIELRVFGYPDKDKASSAPRVITREQDAAANAEADLETGPAEPQGAEHVESDAERGICRNCGASVLDGYCSNPQPGGGA